MASEPRGIWGDLAASAFVDASPLFRSLDDDARRDLLRLSEAIVYQAGEIVVRQGDVGDEMFLVLEGQAAVSVEEGGAAREVASLDRGAFFGEFGALGAPVRSATVSARTELEVIRFPGPVVLALSARFPKVRRLLDALQAARRRDGAPG